MGAGRSIGTAGKEEGGGWGAGFIGACVTDAGDERPRSRTEVGGDDPTDVVARVRSTRSDGPGGGVGGAGGGSKGAAASTSRGNRTSLRQSSSSLKRSSRNECCCRLVSASRCSRADLPSSRGRTRSSAVELFWRRSAAFSLSGHAARFTNCASPTSSTSGRGPGSSGSGMAGNVEERGEAGGCVCDWDSLNSCRLAATLRAIPYGAGDEP